MKIACLWVPDLPLVAALRAEPQLCSQPLAVVQAGRDLGGRAPVPGATPAADRAGAGQTLAEARATCPRLLTRGTSPVGASRAAPTRPRAAAAESCSAEVAGAGVV